MSQPVASDVALDIHNLQKPYGTGVHALKGVSFQVQAGDFFALLGPNGAGKSTLIGIVSSLVNATDGDAKVFGVSVREQRSKAMQFIGLVPQEINFNQFEKPIDICIHQAGFYGIDRIEARRRAEKYLRELSLWDKAFSVSRTLSGGMKRRLMIARAMMNEPKLLILDEPTAGVDIEIRRSMWKFVEGINQAGTTVILTTHYLEEAEQLCRNIAIIDKGQIVKHTTMKALIATLDRETFVLDLLDNLDHVPNLDGLEVRRVDAQCIEVDLPRDHQLNDLFKTLDQKGLKVRSLRNKANRLEELFLGLVEKNKESK